MSDIEIFIFVLLTVLVLFNWYILYKIDDYGWNVYRVKSRLDAIGYIQNEIIKTIEKDIQGDDLNNGKEVDG